MSQSLLAIDLGAESGRVIGGRLREGRLAIEELHRFPTGVMPLLGRSHWNLFRFQEEIRRGLTRAAGVSAARPASLAVDTWGVDFALVSRDGSLLGAPLSYRERAFQGAPERFYRGFDKGRLYALTGLQELPFNTLFQLHTLVAEGSPFLAAADSLLFMPDAVGYLLTGRRATEHTIASTSQLYDAVEGLWIDELVDHLGVARGLLGEILRPGDLLGPLLPEVAEATGLGPVPVRVAAGHDTAAAVAAVPATAGPWSYISCGTWSLVGCELTAPVRTEPARAANFTNEGGVAGTHRFLRNVMGLWLLQECRRIWSREREYGYPELLAAAAQAPPFAVLVDPDWPGFLNPPSMPAAIADWCRRTGQRPPAGVGATTRAILEGLALKYRLVLEEQDRILGRRTQRLHLVGGGCRNSLLCAFTSAATGLEVVAGPVEATAVGNLLVQAMGLGWIADLPELRRVVARSFPPERYEPAETSDWTGAFGAFRELIGRVE